MPRPEIRNIEMNAKTEAFLTGADDPVGQGASASTPKPKAPKRKKATPTLKVAKAAAVANDAAEDEPTKKWTAAFKLSTVDLIERRFHEYYTADKGRLSKRDLVEALLADALQDDARVLDVLGPPPK